MQTFVSWESWINPILIGSACFILCGFCKYHMTAGLKSLGKTIVIIRNAERPMANYVRFVMGL